MDSGNTSNVVQMLQARALEVPEAVAFHCQDGGDAWHSVTWSDYWLQVRQVAAGFSHLGLTSGDPIAIVLPTCKEWEIIEKAGFLLGATIIGIEPHAPSAHMQFVLSHCGAKMLVASDASLLAKLDAAIANQLSIVLTLEESDEQLVNSGTQSITWRQMRQASVPAQSADCELDASANAAVLIYTSGTTGTPKGILYNNSQLMLACTSILDAFGSVGPRDTSLCWLPLANLFQRIMNLCAMAAGASIYLVADPQHVMQAIQSARPTFFIGVPRFYEKLYAGINAKIAGLPAWQRRLIAAGLAIATRHAERNRPGDSAPWHLRLRMRIIDALLLSRLRQSMGGRIRFMISGSAPCPPSLTAFFEAIRMPLLEAYGVSENIIPIASNRPDDYRPGSVGKPLEFNEVTLDENGQVLVRGPGVFTGYYRDEQSRQCFTPQGYYQTGDIGHFDAAGYLHLTGRQSEIIKTSTGRRISLVHVENTLRSLPLVDQAMVVGSSQKALVAVITLSPEQLKQMETGDASTETQAAVEDRIAKEIERYTGSLAPYEKVRGIIVAPVPFSVASGELTPNLKMRRAIIEEKYAESIARLYDELENITKASGTAPGQPKVRILCLQK